MSNKNLCFECENKISIDDFIDNNYYEFQEKKFHLDCFYKHIDDNNMFICDKCYEISLKENNFIMRKNKDNEEIYYHKKCVITEYICIGCNDDLESGECIEILVDWGVKKLFHKKCVENENIVFNLDICNQCYKAFKVKCLKCNKKFKYCYGGCNDYDKYSNVHYDGNCASCNW